MDRPLIDAWHAARARKMHPLQIPGHKYRYGDDADGTAPGYDLLHPFIRDDIALQGGVDDNAYSNQFLAKSEALWANAVGGDHARFLLGGSSQGNIAALNAVADHGDRVILDRTSHRSLHAALIISGAWPVWVLPRIHPEFGIPVGMHLDVLPDPSARLLFVTSPSYVGTISDVRALATLVHQHRMPLIVDQAWGAHLDFVGAGAIGLGADLVTTSVHKALMGGQGTAVTTMRGELVSAEYLNQSVDLLTTTSPSGTMLASIEASREVMEDVGRENIERVSVGVQHLRAKLAATTRAVPITNENAGCAVDPLKLTLWLPRSGATGTELAKVLWAEGIGVEAADTDTLVMSFSVADDDPWIEQIGEQLVALIQAHEGEPRTPVPSEFWRIRPETVITPREAFHASRRRVPLRDAVGLVSAEQFTPYPPGVPLVAPGERITAELVEAIQEAAKHTRVAYSSDPTLVTVDTVAE